MQKLLYQFSTTKLFAKIPFTYIWIIKRAIGDVKTVLDLGCAKGIFTEVVANGENWRIVGLELYEKYIVDAKRTKIYSEVLKGDVTKLPKTIKSTKYDLVLCHQVIEHIEKSKGLKALKDWEKLSKKRIVIGTTVGFIKYEQKESINMPEKGNTLLTHKSGWMPEDFRKLGYEVYGQGVRKIYGENGLWERSPQFLHPILKFASYLLAPVIYFNPQFAQVMICKKEID